MVVPRNILFKDLSFQGFYEHGKYDFESIILANSQYMEREKAEINFEFKQPIAYTAIINLDDRKIFAYTRSKLDKNYKEKRLQGKFSIGLGGHIDKKDNNESNPITASRDRELKEEVRILGYSEKPQLLGYINDDGNDVGKVHFGLLYYLPTDARTISPLDPEIENCKFYNYKRLENIINNHDNKGRASHFFKLQNVEGWTKIAIYPIVDLLDHVATL